MAFVWIQNPNRAGDTGKRYVTEEKAALLAGSGWTVTTAPDGAPSPVPGSQPVTHDELEAALLGLGSGGSTPDATSTVKGKVRVMDGTADNPLYPASRITGQLQPLQLPPLAIVDYLGAVASQAAMLALSGQKGDWCVRTDTGKGWIVTGSDPTQMSSWTVLPYPAATLAGLTDLDQSGAAAGRVVAVADDDPLGYKLLPPVGLSPELYGAAPAYSSSVDDTAAVQAAIAAGKSLGIDVILTRRYRMTGGIVWDPSAHSVRGLGNAILDFTGLTSGFAVRITSTHTAETRYRQIRSALSGVEILGPTADATTTDCFWIDGTGGVNNAFFNVVGCKIEGFRDQLWIKDNNWCWVFQRCSFGGAKRRGVWYDADNYAGENLTFISCVFHGADNNAKTAVAVYAPHKFIECNFNFWGCSFDYNNLEFDIGSGSFNLYACHFEDENTGPMIRTSSGTAYGQAETHFVMYGGRIYIRNAAPERSHLVEHTTGGRTRILFSGVRFSTAGRQYDVVKVLDASTPLVRLDGCYFEKSGADNAKQALPGELLNLLYNPGFELGNTNGWAHVGTVATPSVQTTDVRVGTQAYQVVGGGAAGQRTLSQRFPIQPGQAVVARTAAKLTGMTGGAVNLYLRAYNADGTLAITSDHVPLAADRPWGEIFRRWVPPQGTAFVEYRISFDNLNGTALIDNCYMAFV